MKLNDPQHPWTRLTGAARTARDERATAAPTGFATRVVAYAFEREFRPVSLFERYAARALGIASLLALLSVAVNFSALTTPTDVEEDEPADSPIALLLTVD